MHKVEELDVYQNSLDLVISIYNLTNGFPKYEIFGITSQLRRAAVSIGANLAEGFHRKSMNDFIRFINYSCGSAAELRFLIEVCSQLNYLTKKEYSLKMEEIITISKMLNGLRISIINKVRV